MGNLLHVEEIPVEFTDWLNLQVSEGKYVEVVISKKYVISVNVKEPDNGDWSTMEYGTIAGSNGLWFKQNVYHPAIVLGKFVYNYNGKRKETREE